MACFQLLDPSISVFCWECKEPNPPNWTTGNKSLDSFIKESWTNTKNRFDSYVQGIEFAHLTNIQKKSSLPHGCAYTADWSESTANGTKVANVMLKKIVDGQNAQSFDFYQVR